MAITELRTKIKRVLEDTPEGVAGYLFVSVEEGYEHKRSDIDIAVLFDGSLDKFQMFDLEIKLGNRLQEALKKRVDLLVLNRSDPSLIFPQRHYQKILAKVLYERARDYEPLR